MLRIVLTGGGTGGHVYPLLAVADELQSMMRGGIMLTYVGPKSRFFDEFEKRGIAVRTVAGAKLRRGYGFFQNLLDVPRFFAGLVQALAKLYALMPDAVFSKGGPGAFAVVLAARFYFIPVMIHESDAVPGLTSRLSAPLAKRIGIAFPGATRYFPAKKTVFVGNPVRRGLIANEFPQAAAKRELNFNTEEPLLLVLGGSQGAVPLNTFIADNLALLLEKFQILHQTGEANAAETARLAEAAFRGRGEALRKRYRAEGNLDDRLYGRALSAADLVLSRAGGSAIYELAAFGKPSILVPLAAGAANNHQQANAREYAETGAATVVEPKNLTVHVFLDVAQRLLEDRRARENMAQAARTFFKPQAAETIAREIIAVAVTKAV